MSSIHVAKSMHHLFTDGSLIRNDVLIFMDIDNTFLKIKGKESLGSDQWFKWQLRLIDSHASAKEGRVAIDADDLGEKLLRIYEGSTVEPCEPCIPDIIKTYLDGKKNAKLVFITSRSDKMKDITVQQLNSILGSQEYYDLILCNGTRKLDHIVRYINKKKTTRHDIIIIDDMLEHLVPFTGSDNPLWSLNINMKLVHYTNQFKNVDEFNNSSKEKCIEMYIKLYGC